MRAPSCLAWRPPAVIFFLAFSVFSAVAGTKHDDLIVCASTACFRARLRTEPRPLGSAGAITYDAGLRLVLGTERLR
jgi:hypothetical protein